MSGPTGSRDVPPGSSWAFRDHRTQAALSPPVQAAIRARVIEADRLLFDRSASPSLRRLAARVIGRWGQVSSPCDVEC